MLENILDLLLTDLSGLLIQFFFAFTILLMVFDRQKPPLLTGVLTGLALIVLGVGGSFHAPAVGAASVFNGLLWLIVAWQRLRQIKS